MCDIMEVDITEFRVYDIPTQIVPHFLLADFKYTSEVDFHSFLQIINYMMPRLIESIS